MTGTVLEEVEIAAVTAAIAACLGRAPESLRLLQIHPVEQPGGSRPWALAARLHQMDGRRWLQARRNGR